MLPQRIENRRFEKNLMFFKWSGIITLILAIIRVAFDDSIFNGTATIGDFISLLIPIVFFLQYRKTAKKLGGQFIAWTDNQLLFKTRDLNKTTLEIDTIEAIEIKLDAIIIKTNEAVYKLNIEDYTAYEDRLQIKRNFEHLKQTLPQSH